MDGSERGSPGLGAVALGQGAWHFEVWAPHASKVEVELLGPDRLVPLTRDERGYHRGVVEDLEPGARYRYVLDGGLRRPDPCSRHQPEGVHGPSELVDPAWPPFAHTTFRPPPLERQVIYELHVGTFSPEGTFDGVARRLESLRDLGVTTIELMPVAQFPGARNWGYDGVLPFAVQHSYGGPEGLRRLVDAAHAHGLAVLLDVVCNHLGPEGNYLRDFGPYFDPNRRSPWGDGLNLEGPGSDEVRRFFLEAVRTWIRDFHLDGLRLDAVHAIEDLSARPFSRQIAEAVHDEGARLGRVVVAIAENDRNDPRIVRPPELGGDGYDAVWSDDFHHAIHARLTGEREGYYADFGSLDDVARAWAHGFAYEGRYSTFRGRRHGAPARDLPGRAFVVCVQNHDQVGNRMLGERLSTLAGLEGCRLAAGLLLLAPRVPLLFMGEEWGETAPFLYFTDHGDPGLADAVREGRRDEFAHFSWAGEPPDPQAPATFERSRVDPARCGEAGHAELRELYRELLRLRRDLPALASLDPCAVTTACNEGRELFVAVRGREPDQVCAVFHFGARDEEARVPVPPGRWCARLDSSDRRWGGPGSAAPTELDSDGEVTLTLPARSFLLLERMDP